MNKATKWLSDSSRTYAEGLKIYVEAFGTDDRYHFFSGVSDASMGSLHFNLLEEKMHKAARILPAVDELPPSTKASTFKVAAVRSSKPGKVRIVDNPLVEVTQLPETHQKMYFDNKRLTIEIAAEHSRLKSDITRDARAECLEKLKQLEASRRKNWEKIDAWWNLNKGSLAALPEENTVNTKRKDTLRKNIHRAEKELTAGNLDKARIAARQIKLETWKQELKDISNQNSSSTTKSVSMT